MEEPIKDEEYILSGSWCIVEKVDDEGVHLYFGTHSSIYPLEDFKKEAELY